jgi:hypothetical protein
MLAASRTARHVFLAWAMNCPEGGNGVDDMLLMILAVIADLLTRGLPYISRNGVRQGQESCQEVQKTSQVVTHKQHLLPFGALLVRGNTCR